MSQNRPSYGTASEQERQTILRTLDQTRSVRWTRRWTARGAVFLAYGFTTGAIGMGAMYVAPAGTANIVERISESWIHLLSAAHLSVTHFSAVVSGVGPQRTLAMPLPQSRAEPAPAAAAPPGQNIIVYGDRLKVSFFESISLVLGDTAKEQGVPSPVTIFPRMDLTGEYVVDETGGLDIPRLGWRAVAGQGVSALESELAVVFKHAFGRPGTVHIAFLDRRPVYILGGPRGGATIKHAPGMIVLQALAEAGGYQPSALDTSRTIEAIRETQRLGEAQDRLVRALLRHARLTALRDGLSTITLPPATTAQLAETCPQDAAGFLQNANATLTLELLAHAEQLALANRQTDIANMELAAQELRSEQAGALVEIKTSRLQSLERIAVHGDVSRFKLTDVAVEVSEATARQDDLRATVAQAQSRLVEAEIMRTKLMRAYMSQVTLDLASAAQEVGDLRRTVAAIKAVVAVLDDGREASVNTATAFPGLQIIRRESGGTSLVPAFDSTPLMPGDVLRIGPSSGALQSDVTDAPLPPSYPRKDAFELASPR